MMPVFITKSKKMNIDYKLHIFIFEHSLSLTSPHLFSFQHSSFLTLLLPLFWYISQSLLSLSIAPSLLIHSPVSLLLPLYWYIPQSLSLAPSLLINPQYLSCSLSTDRSPSLSCTLSTDTSLPLCWHLPRSIPLSFACFLLTPASLPTIHTWKAYVMIIFFLAPPPQHLPHTLTTTLTCQASTKWSPISHAP